MLGLSYGAVVLGGAIIVGFTGTFVPGNTVGKRYAVSDSAATAQYVAAYARLAGEVRLAIPRAEDRVAGLSAQVATACPGVLAVNAGAERGFRAAEEEVNGALEVAIADGMGEASARFGSAVGGLRWSSQPLTGAVQSFAVVGRSFARLPRLPSLCDDMRAGAEGSIHGAPSGMRRFNTALRRALTAESATAAGGVEDEIVGLLNRYTDLQQREALVKARQAMGRAQQRELRLWSGARYTMLRDLGLRTPILK